MQYEEQLYEEAARSNSLKQLCVDHWDFWTFQYEEQHEASSLYYRAASFFLEEAMLPSKLVSGH